MGVNFFVLRISFAMCLRSGASSHSTYLSRVHKNSEILSPQLIQYGLEPHPRHPGFFVGNRSLSKIPQ